MYKLTINGNTELLKPFNDHNMVSQNGGYYKRFEKLGEAMTTARDIAKQNPTLSKAAFTIEKIVANGTMESLTKPAKQ